MDLCSITEQMYPFSEGLNSKLRKINTQRSRKQFGKMDIREELDSISKADLIELIIDMSDNGYYPLDLFFAEWLIGSECSGTGEYLERYIRIRQEKR